MRNMTKLTEQQAAFVLHFTSTSGAIGNATEAARRAGYSERTAREIGYQLLRKPHVRDAVDEANREMLSGTIATKAVALLERVLDDEEAPLKVRLEAAKTVLDRAGLVPPSVAERAVALGNEGKPLAEMSLEELNRFIAAETAAIEELQRGMPKQIEGKAVEIVRDGDAS